MFKMIYVSVLFVVFNVWFSFIFCVVKLFIKILSLFLESSLPGEGF
jgi:hypothetical protein